MHKLNATLALLLLASASANADTLSLSGIYTHSDSEVRKEDGSLATFTMGMTFRGSVGSDAEDQDAARVTLTIVAVFDFTDDTLVDHLKDLDAIIVEGTGANARTMEPCYMPQYVAWRTAFYNTPTDPAAKLGSFLAAAFAETERLRGSPLPVPVRRLLDPCVKHMAGILPIFGVTEGPSRR
jgi:hypothetical protein